MSPEHPIRTPAASPSSAAVSRREFLAASGAGAAALACGSRPAAALVPAAAAAQPKRYPIGIELYAVRGELQKDLPNTLKTVREIGYEVVEFYSPYLGWTFPYAKDVRRQLDDLGLRCWSTHNSAAALGEQSPKAIELNQILGARHIVLASPPPNTRTLEDWKRAAASFTAAVEQLRPHGLTAGFHNHQTEWRALPDAGGQRAMDVIAANTPADFVLQLDVGTALEAGVDPVAWIKANPGRIRSMHVKDWAPGTAAENKSYRVLFAEGVAPWKEIFAAAESVGGIEFYLMEQEGSRYGEFETARRCLETWRSMRKGT